MSFELSSGKAAFLGYEDLHEHEFADYERYEPNLEMYQDEDVDGLCVHDLSVYPASKFLQTFKSKRYSDIRWCSCHGLPRHRFPDACLRLYGKSPAEQDSQSRSPDSSDYNILVSRGYCKTDGPRGC
jgi:hypothetical protein